MAYSLRGKSMTVENYTNVTNLEQKAMRWRPKKPGEKKTREVELLSPEEIAHIIDELTLNSLALATQKEELSKIHQELQDLKNQYDDVYENAPIGYVTLDRSGLMTEANRSLVNLLKMEKQDLIGTNLTSYIAPASQDAFYSLLDKVFETKSLQYSEVVLRVPDGSEIYSRLEGIFVNNIGSSKPIPLCRIAFINSMPETDTDKLGNSSKTSENPRTTPTGMNEDDGRKTMKTPPASSVVAIQEQGDEIFTGHSEHKPSIPVGQFQTELQNSLNTTAKMVEMRDSYSVGHQQKVSRLGIAIARELGLSEEQTRYVGIAGLVHDIGKIDLPGSLLVKRTRLDDKELQKIKDHVRSGHDILRTMGFPPIIAIIVLQHHERLDGSGYPFGLKGDDILLESRILGVADSMEAMGSQRAYRPAMSLDAALDELSINKGILYDSDVVQACLKLFQEKGFVFD
jgi:putative nucleotidyltransferase with HDIG domain/PAS domain S-box-containing protein